MAQNNESPESNEYLVEGLKFSGAITASITHELNNVLGTIEQISGLLEDLAFTLEGTDNSLVEQLNDISTRVNRQTDRGTTLIKNLNTFAHSSDSVTTEIHITDVLKTLSALMARMAKMNKVSIDVSQPEEDIVIYGYPFFILQMVFGTIRRILPVVTRDTVIEVSASHQDDNAVISISGVHENAADDISSGDYIERLCSVFGGRIEENITAEKFSCLIILPVSG